MNCIQSQILAAQIIGKCSLIDLYHLDQLKLEIFQEPDQIFQIKTLSNTYREMRGERSIFNYLSDLSLRLW